MRAICVALLVAACGHPTAPEGRAPVADPCSALALGLATTAKPLAAWPAPAGCTWQPVDGVRQLTTPADLQAALSCPSPEPPLGLDLAASSLVVTTEAWSPAQIGLRAFDDGRQVTLVRLQRAPCAADPRPMPTPPITSAFTTTTTAPRTFASRACTVPTTCR
ncbi:MAG: hypothetical protein R3B06_32735 [Kofleriaceae bacterium]